MTLKGILAGIVAVAFVGTVGLVVLATDNDQEGEAPEARGFMEQLHQIGLKIHGDGDSHQSHGTSHMAQMAGLVAELDLNDQQQARLERIHEILGKRDHGDPAAMAELHEKLMAQFEAGRLETDPLHDMIDAHLEQIRQMAYGVTDEMVGLINELDQTQRDLLRTRLEQLDGHEG